MKSRKDRRHTPRMTLEPPEVGLLLFASDGASEGPFEAFYVDLINRSQGGALIKTRREIRRRTHLQPGSS